MAISPELLSTISPKEIPLPELVALCTSYILIISSTVLLGKTVVDNLYDR